MVAKFICLLLLVAFSAVALGSSVAPESKGVPAPFPDGFVVRAESGILVDLTGSWLGDYDASDDTNFIQVDIAQDPSNTTLIATFADSGDLTFNVTLTTDQMAALGQAFLYDGDEICGSVIAAAQVWDENHFTFAWGAGTPCGSPYGGQTGEFFRNIGNCPK